MNHHFLPVIVRDPRFRAGRTAVQRGEAAQAVRSVRPSDLNSFLFHLHPIIRDLSSRIRLIYQAQRTIWKGKDQGIPILV